MIKTLGIGLFLFTLPLSAMNNPSINPSSIFIQIDASHADIILSIKKLLALSTGLSMAMFVWGIIEAFYDPCSSPLNITSKMVYGMTCTAVSASAYNKFNTLVCNTTPLIRIQPKQKKGRNR